MKIRSIKIRNFRSILEQEIDCAAFNTFVGPNGSGKSTLLNALNVFFGEIASFTQEDFHKRNTRNPIQIGVTFTDLSPEAQNDFEHYVRGGELVVQVEIKQKDENSYSRVVRGERLIFPPFKNFFEVKTATERGKIFKALREKYTELEPATNDGGRVASVRDYEEGLPEEKKELVLSGAEFFGVSKGVDKFKRHVNWVYVPAVKDAASESEEAKNSHLGKLIQHTIRSGMDYETDLENIRETALNEYEKLLAGQRTHLSSLQDRLSQRLQDAVATETDLKLDWKKDEKSVAVQDPTAKVLLTDRGFEGEVDKFGHGLQRSFLLVILQELMAADSDVSPTLILGCEEPELYQHPPQARHLAEILMSLSKGDAQVFITTHSPYFIDVEHYDGIKMFRNISGNAVTSRSTFASIQKRYNEAFDKPLQNEDQARTKLAIQTQPKFNEVFFADKVILVEGISDLACLETYLRLSGRKSEFQKSGAAIIACEGKSSLALMMLIVKDFQIPYHVIFDCDADCDEKKRNDHIRDNDAIFATAGQEKLQALPDKDCLHPNVTAWMNNIEHILELEYGDDATTFKEAGYNAVGHLKSPQKNPIFISAAMKKAWDEGRRFKVFDTVISQILKLEGAKKSQTDSDLP